MVAFRSFASRPPAKSLVSTKRALRGFGCVVFLLWLLTVTAPRDCRAQGAGLALDPPATAEGDRAAAELMFGAQWKDLVRRSGMIFFGTVVGNRQPPNEGKTFGSATGATEITFSVERGIAGVEAGQPLTVREWAGAEHRVMRPGQRFLLLLYAPSRLGLTSPVGGALGEVLLDKAGESVAETRVLTSFITPSAAAALGLAPLAAVSSFPAFPSPRRNKQPIRVDQLVRAMRTARSSGK